MTTEDLKRLQDDTNKAIHDVGHIDEPINWGSLRCIEASEIRTDKGCSYLRVLIEEAAPECPRFRAAVMAKLQPQWGIVAVTTEW